MSLTLMLLQRFQSRYPQRLTPIREARIFSLIQVMTEDAHRTLILVGKRRHHLNTMITVRRECRQYLSSPLNHNKHLKANTRLLQHLHRDQTRCFRRR